MYNYIKSKFIVSNANFFFFCLLLSLFFSKRKRTTHFYYVARNFWIILPSLLFFPLPNSTFICTWHIFLWVSNKLKKATPKLYTLITWWHYYKDCLRVRPIQELIMCKQNTIVFINRDWFLKNRQLMFGFQITSTWMWITKITNNYFRIKFNVILT